MSNNGRDWPIVGAMNDCNPRRLSKGTAACSKLRARIIRKRKRIALANDRLEDHLSRDRTTELCFSSGDSTRDSYNSLADVFYREVTTSI